MRGARPHTILLLGTSLAVFAAACNASAEVHIGSPPVEKSAETAIEDQLADQLGLGALTARCNAPATEDVGTKFRCTAETPDGRVVEFMAVITESGASVETTNVLRAEKIPAFEAAVVRSVAEATKVDLADDAVDCGEETLLADESGEVVCAITDPDGVVWDITIDISRLTAGGKGFDWQIADRPRG